MEGKYIKKCADVAVAQTQKKCNMTEKELKDEIDVRINLNCIQSLCSTMCGPVFTLPAIK